MFKWFNNIRVATKVGILAGVLLSLSLAIGGAAIYMVQQIGGEIEEISEVHLPMLEVLTELQIKQHEQAIEFERALRHAEKSVAGMNIGNRGAVAEFEKATRKFAQLGEVTVEEAENVETIIATAIEQASNEETVKALETFRADLKKYGELHEVYQGHVEAVFQLLDQGQIEAALARVDSVEEKEEAVDRKISELVEYVDGQADKSALAAEADESTARSTIMALLGVAFAVGLFFAFLIGGGIAGSLRKITDAMTRLAEGGAADEIEVPGLERKDEVGRMAQALEVFKQAAVDKAEMERQQAVEIAVREKQRAEQAQKDARIQAEIDQAVSAAGAGDFSQRVDTEGFDGVMLNLGDGMNELLETVDRGLTESVEIMAALADGDLTKRMVGDYQGSFLKLKEDANRMAEQIGTIVGRISAATGSVRNAAGEIDSGASELSTRAESQAASLEETAAAMEQIAATVKTNAENAIEANSLAEATRGQAERGREVVAETVRAMANIRESSTEIGDIVSTIEAIAFQTNLLALNAAVEAARAGDAGKGFAVVASEVRTLAQRSGEAAKTIKDLIGKSTGHVEAGDRLVGETDTALSEILEGVRNLARTVEEITDASKEQTTGVEEVSSTVSQMDEMTQQNASMADRSAAAARGLTEQSETLVELVRFFNTGAASGSSSGARIGADRDRQAWDRDAKTETEAARKPAPAPRPALAGNGTWGEF
jgi:methyl-accepting chemotaxis protein